MKVKQFSNVKRPELLTVINNSSNNDFSHLVYLPGTVQSWGYREIDTALKLVIS